jgi:predicted TIM-barrel fold metal-dependent hydrolase
MRIDAHVHGKRGNWPGTAEEFVAKSRAAGVERAALIAGVEETLQALKESPDYIIAVPRFDIDAVKVKEIHDAIDAGAAGIKFINPRFSYGDTRYDPLYAAISDRKKVAVFHTGYLGRGRVANPPNHTDITLMRPAAIDFLSRRHPDLKILMSHYGNPWWEEAWKVTWSVPNVYADLCGGTAIYRSLLMWREMFAPNGTLDEVSLSKLLFATDMSIFEEGYVQGCAPYFEFYDKLFDAVGASEAQREAVNRGTAMRLFGLE